MEIKHIEDYYDAVKEKFPDLDTSDIAKILKHGLKSLYLTNLYGADVLFKHPKFTMYFGEMFKDAAKFWKYWHFKSALKLRIKYKRSKPQFDGYYYFGITEEEHEKYNLSKKGRKTVTFDEIILYKIMDEAFLDRGKKYFYKLKVKEEMSFKEYFKNFKTSQFSLIGKRNSKGDVKLV